MNKLFTKIAGLVLGLAMAAGVGVGISSGKIESTEAATIGTNLIQVSTLTSGKQYVIVGNNNSYALPTDTAPTNGKITGTVIASVPSDASGFLWTFTKNGQTWKIGDAKNYIYHSNGGSSGTNLGYGTASTYEWNLTFTAATSTKSAYWTFKGVGSTGTIGTRGMLCNSNTFGGYAISNQSSYGYMNIYEVNTSPLVSEVSLTPSSDVNLYVGGIGGEKSKEFTVAITGTNLTGNETVSIEGLTDLSSYVDVTTTASGGVSALKNGEKFTLTAKTAGANSAIYAKYSDTIKSSNITVKTTEISVSKPLTANPVLGEYSTSMYCGKTQTLSFTLTPSDTDETITVSSSNTKVLTVTKVTNTSYTVNAIAAGSATITVKGDLGNYSSTTEEITVSEDSIQSTVITGSMTKTSYLLGENWDNSGFVVKVYYASDPDTPVIVSDGISWSYDPEKANSTSITSVSVTATVSGVASEALPVTVTVTGPLYSQSMSDWIWSGESGKIYANSIAGTSEPNRHWRLSSSEYFGSSSITYVLGDYNSSGNGTWSKFSTSNYYKNIASAITSTNYGFAMYSQDFSINGLNKIKFSWGYASGLSGTSNAYIVVSTDNGSSWTNISNVSALGTNMSISWEGNTYSSTNNIIIGLAFTSSTTNGQLRNISVEIYGNSFGTPSWPMKKIDVSGDANVEVSSTITLSATTNTGFEPAGNPAVTWSSSSDSIATVNSSTGEVTGVSAGSVTITATSVENNQIKGTKQITVVAATIHVSSLSLNVTTLEMEQYGESALTVTVLPANATDKTVTWSTSDSDIVDVDESGNLLAYRAGEATITVTSTDGGKTATCTVTVVGFVGDYELVTSEDQLFEGAKVMFATYKSGTSGYSVACGSWNSSSKCFSSVSADFSDDFLTMSSDNAQIFNVHKYGNNYVFGYVDSDKEYFFNSNNKAMSISEEYSDSVAWNLSISSSSFEMTGKTATSVRFNYNSGSPRFKNYDNTQVAIKMYIETSSKSATDNQIVDTFVNTELHMRDYTESLGYCSDSDNHYYSTAKTKYNSLTANQKSIFNSAEYTEAQNRLIAWARANGEILNSDLNLVKNAQVTLFESNNATSIIAIIIVSIAAVSAVGGYFFIRRRKEN